MGEAGTLMCCVGNVGSSALSQKIELSHKCSVVEMLIKQRVCSAVTKNPSG